MKSILIVLLALFPILASGQTFSATLSGANEVGGGDPDGSGLAVVTINGNQIGYTILVSGIEAPDAAHIHAGATGVNGNVVVNFSPAFIGGTAIGTVTADPAIVSAILANPASFYVNVHNAPFPNGAVRGQLASSSADSGGSLRSFIPIAGKISGAAGTNFVSDVRIVNRGSSVATVTLRWWPDNPAGASAPAATRTVTVPAGTQLVLDDVIGEQFGLNQIVGTLEVASDIPVVVTSRIINDLRGTNQGTAGFAFAARSLEEAQTSGVLSFLSMASGANIGAGIGFRTNLGWFNPQSAPVTATFTAHRSSDGSVLGSHTATIPAGAVFRPTPVFSVITSVAAADQVQEDFYVTYTAGAPIFVYASVTDNRTGDGVFIQ
ncbi:MAG TPA: CHRD domain-containing protein [Thermoanaerobaculia bacterium]|nr:CHRD domain-containing protein [Thermoanaerobaculia bacterium]